MTGERLKATDITHIHQRQWWDPKREKILRRINVDGVAIKKREPPHHSCNLMLSSTWPSFGEFFLFPSATFYLCLFHTHTHIHIYLSLGMRESPEPDCHGMGSRCFRHFQMYRYAFSTNMVSYIK